MSNQICHKKLNALISLSPHRHQTVAALMVAFHVSSPVRLGNLLLEFIKSNKYSAESRTLGAGNTCDVLSISFMLSNGLHSLSGLMPSELDKRIVVCQFWTQPNPIDFWLAFIVFQVQKEFGNFEDYLQARMWIEP